MVGLRPVWLWSDHGVRLPPYIAASCAFVLLFDRREHEQEWPMVMLPVGIVPWVNVRGCGIDRAML